jgi:hypothetical protein
MSSTHESRWLPGAASTGTTIFLALALFGCGKSSLKVPKADAGLDGPSSGWSDGGQGTGGAGATGGAMATGGTTSVLGGGGATGQGTGGATATGGLAGTGGLTGRGGTAGTGAGGATRNGGASGTGGLTGRGGTAGTAAGGATSTGGKTGTGGATGTGGLTGGAGGKSGTGGIGGTGGGTGATMFQPLINAFCATAKNCCGRESYSATDLADCEFKFLSRLQNYPLVDKGTVIVDQNALTACVAAYNTAATACTTTAVNAACKGVFVGTQAEGQPCGGSSKFGAFECKPVNGSATCYWEPSDGGPRNAGVCVGIPRGKSGDACSRTCGKNGSCIVDMIGGAPPFPVACFEEDGLYCSVTTNPAVCKPTLPIDHACTWDPGSCGNGNYCGWTSNTCLAASKLGESCMNAACVNDLMCGTNNRCVELPFASEQICKGIPSVP